MLQIDGVALPERAVRALQALADGVPDDELIAFAKERTELLRGLRPTRQNAPAIRDRLKAAIGRHKQLDAATAGLLAAHSLSQGFLVVLSIRAIAAALDDLAAYYGEGPVLAAALLDERPEVRAASLKRLAQSPEAASPAPDPAAAGERLRHTFHPFLERVSGLVSGTPHPRTPAPMPSSGGRPRRASGSPASRRSCARTPAGANGRRPR